MRVSREQAAENRSRVVDVAGRLFRERGLGGIGVADLMKAAGLTHGGFYGQFDSRDRLVVEAVERAVERNIEIWRRRASGEEGEPLGAVVDGYLSARHRDSVGEGCVLAALAADAARSEIPGLRPVLARGLNTLVETLSRLVPGGTPALRRRRALAKASAMIGALILARAVDDPALSAEILAAVREA